MKLETYLTKYRISQDALSKKAGISHVTVWRIVMGKFNPSLSTASAIHKATKGKVSFNDLLPANLHK